MFYVWFFRMVDSQPQNARTRTIFVVITVLFCAYVLLTDPLDLLMQLPWLIADIRKALSGCSM